MMLYVANMLPAQPLVLGGLFGSQKLRLDDAEYRAGIVASMQEALTDWMPPLLREHRGDGTALGWVVAIRDTPDGVLAYVDVTDEDAREDIDTGASRYVSVGMELDGADNTGRERLAMLWELSLVSVPAFAVGQQSLRRATEQEIATLAADGITRRKPGVMSIAASRLHTLYTPAQTATVAASANTQPTHTEAGMDDVIAQLAALTEMVTAMESRLAALEAAQDKPDSDSGMEDDDMGALEAKDAEVYALRKILANPALAPVESALITLAKVDRAEADKLASLQLSAPTTTAKPTLPVTTPARTTPPATASEPDIYASALRIQASRRKAGESARWEDCMAQARAEAGI